MKFLLSLVVLAASLPLHAQEVKPIRGPVPIPETNPADIYRTEKHDRALPRSHRWQPPVIPHNVKGYQITKNVNTCLVCHSKSGSKESGARPVGDSHYVDREGRNLDTVSGRRYFCLQCHVPQYDADPLVGNTFKP